MEFYDFPLNQNMQELTQHGSPSFPIQYYIDEPVHFSDFTIPLHWHPELEFWVANGGPADVQIQLSSTCPFPTLEKIQFCGFVTCVPIVV